MGVAIAISHITSVASSTVVCVDSTFAGAASVGAGRQGTSFSEHRGGGGGGGGNIIGGRAHLFLLVLAKLNSTISWDDRWLFEQQLMTAALTRF
jgi:hypothetical protein